MVAESDPGIGNEATRRPGGGGRVPFVVLNLLGGIAVLASYVVGLSASPELAGAVWGGVPEALRPVYTVCMFLAAGGYFLFSHYIFWGLPTDRLRVFGQHGLRAFVGLYAVILIPSALWMPLTMRMIETPGPANWWMIRLVLLAVGGASVLLIEAVRSAEPQGSTRGRRLAILGAVLFAFQTAVLDALIWPAYFPG